MLELPDKPSRMAAQQVFDGESQEHFDEALKLHQLGALDEAAAGYQQLLVHYPASAQLHHLLGVIASQRGEHAAALLMIDEAIRLAPDIAAFHANRGIALAAQGEHDAALASYDQALLLSPKHLQSLSNRALVLKSLRRLDDALNSCDRAIALQADFAEAYCNRGVILQAMNRQEEALASYERALSLRPDYAEAQRNRGNALLELDRQNEALLAYDLAIRLQPRYAEAYWSKAIAMLLQGDLAQAWPLYEWRWRDAKSGRQQREFAQPFWCGDSPLQGKRLLIHAEQGLGDSLHFARYLPLLAAQGAQILFEVQPLLAPLFERFPGLSQVIPQGDELPEFDCHCPLLTLPLACTSDLGNLPVPVSCPVLPARTEIWAGALATAKKPRVGIAWRGNPLHFADHNRSLPLSKLLQHLPDGPAYFSLQYEMTPEERALLAADERVVCLPADLADFDDTLAVLDLLDLVVTVDTSVAHLAGMQGKPVWLLLPALPDWRWLRHRQDSPWYPKTRLFRQQKIGVWEKPLQQINMELLAWCRQGEKDTEEVRVTKSKNNSVDSAVQQALSWHQQGDWEKAALAYEAILKEEPLQADACNLLGVIRFQQGDSLAAVELISKAITLRPGSGGYHFNLAIALATLGRHREAIAEFDRVLALDPQHAESHFNRGISLEALGDKPAALASYEKALVLRPDYLEARINRGGLLQAQGLLEEALQDFDRALALKPDFAEVHSNRGTVLQALERLPEAVAAYREALHLRPNYPEGWYNLASAEKSCGRFEDALDSYNRALALRPDYPAALWNKGLLLLLLGDFDQGWPLYEWRWNDATTGMRQRELPMPLWTGEQSLSGRRIFVHAEQGFGDIFQFCRYARLLAERGAHVIMDAPAELLPVLRSLEGVAQWQGQGEAAPACDYQIPLLSLPLAFKTTLETIPPAPYLQVDAQSRARWSVRLGEGHKPRVGLVWRGNQGHSRDHLRSLSLADLVAALPPGLDYLSLQRDLRGDDAAILAQHPEIRHFGDQLATFGDTAALLEHIDVLISVDTGVAHLAGALGKEVWVILPAEPEWRWLTERSDSPWYASARLFRQPVRGDWPAVLHELDQALRARFSGKGFNTWMNLAKQAYGGGQYVQACQALTQAIRLAPAHPEAHALLAAARAAQGQIDAALAAYDHAVALRPSNPFYRFQQGLLELQRQRKEMALACFKAATELRANYPEAWFRRGQVLSMLGRFEEALLAFEQALTWRAEYPEVLNACAVALQAIDEYATAVDCASEAISLRPEDAEAHYNLALACRALGNVEQAMAACERALHLSPDYLAASSLKAELLLLKGDFAKGLPLYAARWQPEMSQQTGSLQGKRVVVHAAVGQCSVGELLLFARYILRLAEAGAHIILALPEDLQCLLAGQQGVVHCVRAGEAWPAHDLHWPLLSLPLLCPGDLALSPSAGAYLVPEAETMPAWAEHLAGLDGLRIGLAWQAEGPGLAALLAVLPAGASYIALQAAANKEETALLAAHPQVMPLTVAPANSVQMAALLTQLDWVIAGDQSLAHLAAALGKPVGVVLPTVPEWPWGLTASTTACYPTARLYRQTVQADWAEALAALRQDLRQRCGAAVGQDRESSFVQDYDAALALLADGQLPAAQAAFESLLEVQPDLAETWHLLAGIALRLGQGAEARRLLSEAIQRAPANAVYQLELGRLYLAADELAAALACCERAQALRADFVEALCLHGQVLLAMGQGEAALAACEQACALQPTHAEAQCGRAAALAALRRHEEALAAYAQALSLDRGLVIAWQGLADCQMALGQYEAAITSYDEALALTPEAGEILYQRGLAQERTHRFDEALASYAQAHPLLPNHLDLLRHLIAMQRQLGHFEAAVGLAQQLCTALPQAAESYVALGLSLHAAGQPAAAVAAFEQALALAPQASEIKAHLARSLLLNGDFARAWPLYAAHAGDKGWRETRKPLWQGGASLAGKTLLIHCDQSLGDTLHFARYLRLLADRGAHVILEVQPELRKLLKGLEGVDGWTSPGKRPPVFDYHLPLHALPMIFASQPLPAPVNIPSPALRAGGWAKRLGRKDKPRIGLVWQSAQTHGHDRLHDLLLNDLLQGLPGGMDYICLQNEIHAADHELLQTHHNIQPFAEALGEMSEVAALIAQLDAVVSVDGTLAHLAGALGKPLALLLPFTPDWRWGLGHQDSVWYPSAQLFRQRRPGDWTAPMSALRAWLLAQGS